MAVTLKGILNGDSGNYETDPSGWGFVTIDGWQVDRVSVPIAQGSFAMRIQPPPSTATYGKTLQNGGLAIGVFQAPFLKNDNGFQLDAFLAQDTIGYFETKIAVIAPNVPDLTKWKIGFNVFETSLGEIIPNDYTWQNPPSVQRTNPIPQSIKPFNELITFGIPATLGVKMACYADPNSFFPRNANIFLIHEDPISKEAAELQLDGLQIIIDESRQADPFPYIDIQGIVTSSTNDPNTNGAIDVTISGGPVGAVYSYEWSNGETTQDLSGISSGNYTLKVSVDGLQGVSQSKTFNVLYEPLQDLGVSGTVTNVTEQGAANGAISIIVTGGSGDYSYQWTNGETTQNISTLSGGNYSVLVIDNQTGQQGSRSFTVIEPGVQEPEIGLFQIPKMQSISFSKGLSKSQSEDGAYWDLSSHCQGKERFPSFELGFQFLQKFRQSDSVTIQMQSQQATINIDIYNEDEEKISTLTPSKKTDYLDRSIPYQVQLQNNGAGQTRVYLQGFKQIPFLLTPNQSSIEIINSTEPDLNGNYLVLAVDTDILLNQQYIVIDKNWSYLTDSETATGLLKVSFVNFDIYEAVLDWSIFDEGNYYLKAYLAGFEEETAFYSEPIQVKATFENVLKINYSNFDNAFDLDYTTGLINVVRPDCIIFKRLPATENTFIRNTDNSRVLLRSKPQRKFEIQFVMLPPYLYEKLLIAFSHDIVLINGVEFTSEEGLGEPDYIEKYGLANASVIVEQTNWFNNYNSNDLGGLEADQNLIIGNDGFIKR